MATTRPDPIVVGEIRARAVRPPSKSGGGWYWRAEVYKDGGARTVWTGRGQRDQVLEELVRLRASGGHAEGATSTEHQAVDTVEMLLRYWVAAQKRRGDLHDESKLSYERHAKRLKAALGHVRLDRVNRGTLEAYRDSVMAEGRAASTVRHDLRVLGMAWRWGFDIGACEQDRLPRVRLNVIPVRSRYTPTAGDAAAMLAAVERLVLEREAAEWPLWVMRVQWATGMRIGEIAALRVRDVQLDDHRIEVVRSKTHASRVVMIRAEFADELRHLVEGRHPDAGLWPVSRKRCRVRVNELLRDLADSAEVPHWSSHGFRRAAVTRWLDAGGGIKSGARQFGHSVQTMIQTYQSLSEGSVELHTEAAALDKLPAAKVVKLRKATRG